LIETPLLLDPDMHVRIVQIDPHTGDRTAAAVTADRAIACRVNQMVVSVGPYKFQACQPFPVKILRNAAGRAAPPHKMQTPSGLRQPTCHGRDLVTA
jgi:hypothetical protein